jgi:uncharacterized integral membrane protein
VSTPSPPDGPRKQSPWTPRRIILGAIALYALVVVLANRNQVAVNFVFFKTEASLFVVLVLAIALGFVAGWLFDDLRDRRRRREGRD